MHLRALPLLYNITLYQGATYRQSFRWLPGGVAADLSGYQARMQIRAMLDRQRIDESTTGLLVDLTTANGGVLLGGGDGTITIIVAAAQSAALQPDTPSRYDLELIDPTGVITRWAMGWVSISGQVSLP